MSRILVADHDVQIRRALATNLRARSFAVDLAATDDETFRLAAEGRPDLVLLDMALPEMGGLAVVEQLRRSTAVPIVVLSERENEGDKIAALDAGADDYVTKPFGMDELLARLRAALRRGLPEGVPGLRHRIHTPDFTVDLLTAQVLDGAGHQIHLTPTEWQLVEVLVRNAGRLVSQRQLVQLLGRGGREGTTDSLRVFMAQLRRKLEPDPTRPRYFITEPGMGVRFEQPHN